MELLDFFALLKPRARMPPGIASWWKGWFAASRIEALMMKALKTSMPVSWASATLHHRPE